MQVGHVNMKKLDNDRPEECKECIHYDSDINKLPCAECERVNTLYDNFEKKEE